MSVIVIHKVPRDGGMVDVTLSQNGTRFVVSVPQILDQGEDAMIIYQHMANEVERRADSLRSIVSGPGMG